MKMTKSFFLLVLVVTTAVVMQYPAGAGQSEEKESGVSMEVYNPSGAVQVKQIHAPRLQQLQNMTICELSDHMWESHRTFPVIRGLLSRQFPEARIVPYTEMPNAYGVDAEVLSKIIREKRCDGVIVGNAA
jgi:hypothetical protein